MPRIRVMRVWLPLCLVTLALCALLSGCLSGAQREQPAEEVLPWNEPAPWEGKILGAPF